MDRASREREDKAGSNCAARGDNFTPSREVVFVSIVRVGLAETKNFAEGYEAIFGKKKEKTNPSKKGKTTAKAATAKKKKKSKKK
jgi:hypothetical protein